MAQQETELQNSTKLTAGTTYHTFTNQGIFLLASHSQRKLKDRLSLKYASLIPETCFIGHVSRPPKATLSRNLPLKTIYSPWTGQKTLIKIYLNLLEMLNFTSFILHTFLNSEASFFFLSPGVWQQNILKPIFPNPAMLYYHYRTSNLSSLVMIYCRSSGVSILEKPTLTQIKASKCQFP